MAARLFDTNGKRTEAMMADIAMKHVMIDIETLATCPAAVICSIGAVEFDPDTGERGREFYQVIDWVNGQAYRVTDHRTIKWWMEQSTDAQMHMAGSADAYDALELDDTLTALALWLPPDCRPWGNGAGFDITILTHAYNEAGLPVPWHHWNVRDCRTIEGAAKGMVSRKDFERKGTYHHALDDAKYQATYISAMWQALRGSVK